MRDKTDPELGKKVNLHLETLRLETVYTMPLASTAREVMANAFTEFFNLMGIKEDPSIEDSPGRIADMLVYELCAGLNYDNLPKCTTQPALGGDSEMVMLKDITTISLCEHHAQTIAGRTHIAYIPNKKLLGVSKLARVTNFFARRPQVQERMTAQIFHALQFVLETDDVAVQQECAHFCIRARGVMDPNSIMTTNKLGGRFMSNPALRSEYLHAIR